ncbi:hypothetical protein [Paraburkholderia rhizosphaerae]|uniref:Uncharacterized protein n=1 Tax=Paraburkholderia rhizosphaerae TaxID=480658 RepID=A0A4R8LSA8_9BURK|nr:hypothetical protein [Paraburkholderia rhizosphaerae]TDY48294.1 hypothetical protein BX592_111229 [Paraburkholderia rhizosphaerae]
MQGRSFFIDRVVSRSREWQCRFPALIAAAHDTESISGGRQIVAAATAETGVRCVLFSNHGSLLDFKATWAELDRAKAWWHFVARWNFFVLANDHDFAAFQNLGPAIGRAIALNAGDAPLSSEDAFAAFLNRAEARARRASGFGLPVAHSSEEMA